MGVLRTALIAITLLTGSPLHAQNAFPWKWGMTPAEVQQVTEYAPYRAFSNGDLETYEAPFQNEKKNYQFYFDDSQPRKLRRIAISLYEGTDIEAATNEWLKLYGTMARLFGEVETPNNTAPIIGKLDAERAFSVKAMEAMKTDGKSQMAPVQRYSDQSVFASFRSWTTPQKETYYGIVLNFDKPQEKATNPASDSSSTP